MSLWETSLTQNITISIHHSDSSHRRSSWPLFLQALFSFPPFSPLSWTPILHPVVTWWSFKTSWSSGHFPFLYHLFLQLNILNLSVSSLILPPILNMLLSCSWTFYYSYNFPTLRSLKSLFKKFPVSWDILILPLRSLEEFPFSSVNIFLRFILFLVVCIWVGMCTWSPECQIALELEL